MLCEHKIAGSLSILTVLILLILPGCAKSDKPDKKDIIAYVNKEPVLNSELQGNIAMRARQNPAFKLTPQVINEEFNSLVNKKILIQQAMEKGLAREQRFVDTIKAFWEQTLIRDFVDYKRKEFQDRLVATEDEIKTYYGNLSEKVTFKVLKSADKKVIDDAYAKITGKKDTESIPWNTIGPISYTDVGSKVLSESYSLPVGGCKIIQDGPDYYLVMVAARQKVELEPFEKLKSEIEKRIIAFKERQLFENWFATERAKAKIKIIKK